MWRKLDCLKSNKTGDGPVQMLRMLRLARASAVKSCTQAVNQLKAVIIGALRSTAQRVQALKAEADDLEREIACLVTQLQPQLVQLPGVGPITAAQS